MKSLNKKNEVKDTEFSLSAVPVSRKSQGLWAAMVVLVGFTFFTPSMTAGGNLGIGLSRIDFFTAVLLGNIFLGIYCGTLGYIGQKTGLSLDLLAHHSFGTKGSFLPSAIISFTQIGWFGVGVAMFAIPVSKVSGAPVWILILITGFIMTMTAYFGIKALAVLGSIAVPLIAVLGVYSVNWGIREVDGFMNVFSDSPAEPLTVAAGIGIVIGSFVSGGTATPNFSRFAKTPVTAVTATVVAFFIGNSIMMVFGAVGGAVTGEPDIFDILILQGLAIPAFITLGLNIWTTNNNALYTAGLGVSNITKIPMKPMVLVGGAVGTVAALWLYYNFVGYLSFLSKMIPPVGAVLIIHYFLNKTVYADENAVKKTVNPGSILAVLAGTAAGFLLPFGVAPLNALITASAVCLISEAIAKGKK